MMYFAIDFRQAERQWLPSGFYVIKKSEDRGKAVDKIGLKCVCLRNLWKTSRFLLVAKIPTKQNTDDVLEQSRRNEKKT